MDNYIKEGLNEFKEYFKEELRKKKCSDFSASSNTAPINPDLPEQKYYPYFVAGLCIIN